MKNASISIMLAAVLFAFAAQQEAAAKGKAQNSGNAVSFGLRSLRDLSQFEAYPFDDGDMSYALAYEVHDPNGYWQVALGFAPDANGTNNIDFALTPEINLVVADSDTKWKWLRAGIGILKTYMSTDDETIDEWSPLYWHLMLGLDIPLGKLSLELQSLYTFEDWDDLGEFDAGELEYGGCLRYFF